MIKAVLFDCDGLMFETEILSQQVWRDEADKAGVILPADFFNRITGSGKAETDAYMHSIPGMDRLEEGMRGRRFDLSFWRSIHTDCLNKKGLIELFQYLQKENYLIAVCSSSPAEYVKALISTVSVPLHYDAMVTGDQVSHAKPDPEIFLTGAKRLHVLPEECLVLEDSKQGIDAANRAGMRSCFIQDTIIPDAEMKKMLDCRCISMLEVPNLLRILNNHQ